MLDGESDATIVEEIGQRIVAVDGYLHLVLFRPNDDAHQRYEYVQRRVQLHSVNTNARKNIKQEQNKPNQRKRVSNLVIFLLDCSSLISSIVVAECSHNWIPQDVTSSSSFNIFSLHQKP